MRGIIAQRPLRQSPPAPRRADAQLGDGRRPNRAGSWETPILERLRWVCNATQSTGERDSKPQLRAGQGADSPPLPPDLPPPDSLPKHVGLIMDGNSRWAQQEGLSAPFAGHQEGVQSLRTAVQCCLAWRIPCLTVFAFSSENWRREQAEVEFLLALIHRVLRAELRVLQDARVRLRFIGELALLPTWLRQDIDVAERDTEDNSKLHLTIAISYSGRQDITSAVQELAHRVALGTLRPADITPALIGEHLSTGGLPAAWQQPDLIIRTSGEQRLSNFLLWEGAYAELYFSTALWPSFGEREFAAALRDFAARERRYGGRTSPE